MKAILSNARNLDHVRFNLTLVRHAETNANAEGIIQGLTDTELSTIGYLQSKALGRYLQYHRFSHIYSSDLRRASETAREIRQLNRISACKIEFDNLLRERMYGIAQGRTRQWLRELAKANGVPYLNYTPPGAESNSEVRQRAITFFKKLCHNIFTIGADSSSPICLTSDSSARSAMPQQSSPMSRSVSSDNLFTQQQTKILRTDTSIGRKRALSTGSIQNEFDNNIAHIISCTSSMDSALDLSYISSSDQQSTSFSSLSSRNSSIGKQQQQQFQLLKSLPPSPYANHFSDIDILVVSHGAVIRELIKYFACDLQTDIGQHFETIQDLAPNTSLTRFEVTYSANEESSLAKLELITYHNKTHLISANSDELNLDVANKCSL